MSETNVAHHENEVHPTDTLAKPQGLPLSNFKWQPSVEPTGITFEALKRWARQAKRKSRAQRSDLSALRLRILPASYFPAKAGDQKTSSAKRKTANSRIPQQGEINICH